MMEVGNSESNMDTEYGASLEWAQSRQLSPTEQRLATMVQALLELEARNNELALAIKQKDIATMDRHIEYHREHGAFTDSMARQTVLEVNKQLNGGAQMEWQIN